MMRKLLQAILAAPLGLLLLYPLSATYIAANLPVYNGGAIAHGSFTTAIPALVTVAYLLLGYVPWFGRSKDSWQRIVSSLLVFPFVTELFIVDQGRTYGPWAQGVWVIYAACALIMTALCFRAKAPVLVPLFLLVPPAFDLFLQLPFAIGGTTDFVRGEFTRHFLPLLLACAAAIAIARITVRMSGRSDR